jgi:hypothetical protein
MPVWSAPGTNGRLRKELYEFHLPNSGISACFRNVRHLSPRGIVELVMADFPHTRRKIRAPRVNLWGRVSATIQLENGRQSWAKTVRLSTTGGLLELANCLDEGVTVHLTLHLDTRPVRGKAAMLFPTCAKQGYLQPFRFTDLRDEESSVLDAEIRELLKQARPFTPGRRIFGFRPARFLESS